MILDVLQGGLIFLLLTLLGVKVILWRNETEKRLSRIEGELGLTPIDETKTQEA